MAYTTQWHDGTKRWFVRTTIYLNGMRGASEPRKERKKQKAAAGK